MTVATDHLWNKHLDAAKAAEVSGSKLKFREPHRGTDYLPVGQWLLAMEHCQDGHAWQMFGDPCYCGSNNCDYCAQCGVEHHD